MQLNIDKKENSFGQNQKWSNGFAVNYLWGETVEQRGAESAEPSTPHFFCAGIISFPFYKSGGCGFDPT